MKTTVINESTNNTNGYPYIGRYNGAKDTLVLFTAPKTGTLLTAIDTTKIGEYSTYWFEHEFKRINSITIEFNS